MAGFEGKLSEVQATRPPRNFGRTRAPETTSTLGFATELFGTLVGGAADILSDQADKELVTKFSTGFSKAVDTSLDRLSKFKKSGEQTGNAGSQAFLQEKIRAFVKQFNTNNPGNEEFILDQLRKRDLILPGLQILRDIAADEDRAELANFQRRRDILTAAVTGGIAVYDDNDVLDEPATLDLMRTMAEAALTTERQRKERGEYVTDAGKIGFTFSPQYIKGIPAQQRAIVVQVLTGMRAPLAKLSELMATGDNTDLKAFKALQMEVAVMSRTFRVAQMELTTDMNAAERDHYMKFVDDTLLTVTQGVLDLDGIKDLNQATAFKNTLDYASRNSEMFLQSELRILMLLSKLSPEFAAMFLKLVKEDNILMMAQLTKGAGLELTALVDWLSKEKDPDKVVTPSVKRGEGEYNSTQRKARAVTADSFLSRYLDQNMVVKTPYDAHLWVGLMGPLFQTYFLPTAEVKFSAADKKRMSQKFRHPNFLANLNAVAALYPEAAMETGSFGFDVVQQELFTIMRKLRNFPFHGSKGENFDIKYNPLTKEFELVTLAKTLRSSPDPSTGEPRADITIVPPVSQFVTALPTLKEDVKIINDIAKFLLSTRKYTPAFKNSTEGEFIKDLGRFITGDIMNLTAEGGVSEITKEEFEGAPKATIEATPKSEPIPDPLTKEGVDLAPLKDEIRTVFPIAEALFKTLNVPFVVTSTVEGEHMEGSKHYGGNAFDIRTRQLAPANQKKMVKDLKAALGPDFDVELESDHIHVEFDPKKKVSGGEGVDTLVGDFFFGGDEEPAPQLTPEEQEAFNMFGPVIKEGRQQAKSGSSTNSRDKGYIPDPSFFLPPIKPGENTFGLNPYDLIRRGMDPDLLDEDKRDFREGFLPDIVNEKIIDEEEARLLEETPGLTLKDVVFRLLEMGFSVERFERGIKFMRDYIIDEGDDEMEKLFGYFLGALARERVGRSVYREERKV